MTAPDYYTETTMIPFIFFFGTTSNKCDYDTGSRETHLTFPTIWKLANCAATEKSYTGGKAAKMPLISATVRYTLSSMAFKLTSRMTDFVSCLSWAEKTFKTHALRAHRHW